MPIRDVNNLKLWQRRSGRESLFHWILWLIGIATFAYCWQQISNTTTWFFVWDAPRIAADIGSRMLPPRWSYITELWEPLWDTINIATLGTTHLLTITPTVQTSPVLYHTKRRLLQVISKTTPLDNTTFPTHLRSSSELDRAGGSQVTSLTATCLLQLRVADAMAMVETQNALAIILGALKDLSRSSSGMMWNKIQTLAKQSGPL